MSVAVADGVVRPAQGLARRLLLPIYGADQAITVTILGAALLLGLYWSGWGAARAIPALLGAYAGVILAMWRAAPCRLWLPPEREAAITAMLDGARLLRRAGETTEWRPARSRLRRWDSDTIRLQRQPAGLLITGRRHDLTLIAAYRGR